MKGKKHQKILIWLLPLIVIGGLFFPLLGYLVLIMMLFFLPLSFFRARYWCWNLCPRGSFLDILLSRMSLGRPMPKIFFKQWFRWSVFSALMLFMVYRLIASWGSWIAVGGVFVSMCVLTTLIAIFLGIPMKSRSWCMICPMGTLQEHLGKAGQKAQNATGSTDRQAGSTGGGITSPSS